MPLYEYHCTECSARFEVLQRMGETGEGLSCPDCGATGVQKQFSTFAAASSSTSAAESCATPGCDSPFT